MVDRTVDNRAREDARLAHHPVIEALQVDRPLPPIERRLNPWDGNLDRAVQGVGGHSESRGVYRPLLECKERH